eukprot:gene6171-2785_t
MQDELMRLDEKEEGEEKAEGEGSARPGAAACLESAVLGVWATATVFLSPTATVANSCLRSPIAASSKSISTHPCNNPEALLRKQLSMSGRPTFQQGMLQRRTHQQPSRPPATRQLPHSTTLHPPTPSPRLRRQLTTPRRQPGLLQAPAQANMQAVPPLGAPHAPSGTTQRAISPPTKQGLQASGANLGLKGPERPHLGHPLVRWKDERRKHFPTAANLARKTEEAKLRTAAGGLDPREERRNKLREIIEKQAAGTSDMLIDMGRGGGGMGGMGGGRMPDQDGRGRGEDVRGPSLLEQLLNKEVRRDHSWLLQAVRFMTKNSFLQKDVDHPLEYPPEGIEAEPLTKALPPVDDLSDDSDARMSDDETGGPGLLGEYPRSKNANTIYVGHDERVCKQIFTSGDQKAQKVSEWLLQCKSKVNGLSFAESPYCLNTHRCKHVSHVDGPRCCEAILRRMYRDQHINGIENPVDYHYCDEHCCGTVHADGTRCVAEPIADTMRCNQHQPNPLTLEQWRELITRVSLKPKELPLLWERLVSCSTDADLVKWLSASLNLSKIFEEGELGALLLRYAVMEPSKPSLTTKRGLCCMEEGKWQEAIDVFCTAVQLQPQDAGSEDAAWLAVCRVKMGVEVKLGADVLPPLAKRGPADSPAWHLAAALALVEKAKRPEQSKKIQEVHAQAIGEALAFLLHPSAASLPTSLVDEANLVLQHCAKPVVIKRQVKMDSLLEVIASWQLRHLPRKALLVSGENYFRKPLLECAKDIEDFQAKLKTLGFRGNITALRDVGRKELENEMDTVCASLEKAGPQVFVFYFTGHGCDHLGQTKMSLVDGNWFCLNTDVISRLEKAGKGCIFVVVLDCCRADDSNRTFKSEAASPQRMVENVPQVGKLFTKNEFLILFACNPGECAESEEGKGGFLTRALIKHMDKPKPIQNMLLDVGATVLHEHQVVQSCWSKSRFIRTFSLSWGDPSSGLLSGEDVALAAVCIQPNDQSSAGYTASDPSLSDGLANLDLNQR